jgi:outer membrane protein assembly factor BamB
MTIRLCILAVLPCLALPTLLTQARSASEGPSLRLRFGLVGSFSAVDKTAAADSRNWPLFRGNPEQTGVTRAPLPAKLQTLWTFKAEDAFENAVSVVGGVVYAASMDEHLYALNLAKGTLKWKYKAAPFKAPTAVRDGCVYVGDLDGNFHCVDAARGTKKWTFETGGEIGGANFTRDDILFASHDENLYCVSKEGKQRWKFKTEGQIFGSPAVAEGKTFLVGCDSQLHVIEVVSGKEVRSVELGGQTAGSACVLGDTLYIGTMRNEVKAIDWKKGDAVWTFTPGRNAQAFYSSPAATNKYILIGSRDRRLHAIDRIKGTAVWSFPTGAHVDSSPVVAGKQVVLGSLDSNLYVLDLDTGKQLQRIELDGAINASPVVIDGLVLVGTRKGTLYCLGK